MGNAMARVSDRRLEEMWYEILKESQLAPGEQTPTKRLLRSKRLSRSEFVAICLLIVDEVELPQDRCPLGSEFFDRLWSEVFEGRPVWFQDLKMVWSQYRDLRVLKGYPSVPVNFLRIIDVFFDYILVVWF